MFTGTFRTIFCFLIVVLISSICNISIAQKNLTDSLASELRKNIHDTLKLEILSELIDKIDEDSLWMPYNEQLGKLSRSLLNHSNAAVRQAAKNGLASHYNNAGYFIENKGDISSALGYYYKSLDLYESTNNKPGTATVLNNIGAVKDRLGDDKEALEFYRKSFSMMFQSGDSLGMAQSLSNMGTIFDNENLPDSALYYYEKSLSIRQKLNDLEGVGISLCNLGGIYDKKNDNERALTYYQQAIEVQKEIDDRIGIALSEISIGHIYFKRKDFNRAEKYFESSMNKAVELGNLDNLRGAANFLSKVYAAQGRYQDAYNMHVKFKKLADSISNDVNRNEAIKLQARYEFEKREAVLKAEQDKKNALAKQEIEKQKIIKKIILVASVIVFVLLVFGFVNFYTRKKESFKRTVEQVNNKALRAQMNPHFIFNSLNSIQNFINQNNSNLANEYLLKFAKLIRMILENSREQEIELEKDLNALELYMQLESLRLKQGFDYSIKVQPDIDPGNVLVPPLIIQPFVENAIWHGLQHKPERGRIDVHISTTGNELICTVQDNGIGRTKSATIKSTETVAKKSLGMKITDERISLYNNLKNVKAFFEIEDLHQGVKAIIHLPYEEAI